MRKGENRLSEERTTARRRKRLISAKPGKPRSRDFSPVRRLESRSLCYGNSPIYGKAYYASQANKVHCSNKRNQKDDGLFHPRANARVRKTTQPTFTAHTP
jgi:hypothetical protein